MKVVIQFYRTRNSDDAHAVVGREVREARDVADAIEIGQRLSQTLDMPQRPDAMTITASASIVMPLALALFVSTPRIPIPLVPTTVPVAVTLAM